MKRTRMMVTMATKAGNVCTFYATIDTLLDTIHMNDAAKEYWFYTTDIKQHIIKVIDTEGYRFELDGVSNRGDHWRMEEMLKEVWGK